MSMTLFLVMIYWKMYKYVSYLIQLVFKLKKALYGLKRVPRAWYQKLCACLLAKGFQNFKCDGSLFLKSINDVFLLVLIYVNDILVTNTHSSLVNALIVDLNLDFAKIWFTSLFPWS